MIMRVPMKSNRVYLFLVVLVVLIVAGGCAKKQFPLQPPRVQVESGHFQGNLGGSEEAAVQGQVESGSEEASSRGTLDPLGDIQEEALTEQEASSPLSASRDSDILAPVPGGSAPFPSVSVPRGVAKSLPFQTTADLRDIHFKYNRHDLDDTAKGILKKNAQWLNQHPEIKVEIQGHCDERGTNNYNLGLGERRALQTKKYLQALGVGARRMISISYGEENPLCTESSENCWWQNRRGHFLVSK